jgi:hypothetical protein
MRSRNSWKSLSRDRLLQNQPSPLAHWPPPFRAGAEKPKVVRYVADEERDRPRSKGFRLTRSSVSKRDD